MTMIRCLEGRIIIRAKNKKKSKFHFKKKEKSLNRQKKKDSYKDKRHLFKNIFKSKREKLWQASNKHFRKERALQVEVKER